LIKSKNNIEKASFYIYRLSLSFSSKGDNFAMTKSRKAKDIYKSYIKWSKRLRGVTIENMDFEKLINQYDREDAFFYIDPPYMETESYYKNIDSFTIDDHIRLRDKLREMYKEFKIVESKPLRYTLGANVHKRNKEVKEIYIMNY